MSTVKRVVNATGRAISIRFTVPGLPVAQPRQRHVARTVGGRVVACNYTPKNSPVNAYKAAVRLASAAAYAGSEPLRGPLGCEISAFFPRPKARKGTDRCWHASRPDVDNLAKSTLDAGIAWLVDDKLVARLVVEKWVCGKDELPRVEVVIWEMRE